MSTRPLSDGDLAALLGVLATVEGLIMVGRVDSQDVAHLGRRLQADGASQGDGEREVRQALNDLNQRLRYALGEHDDPGRSEPVPGLAP